ncbi:hypothetical protein D3C81_2020720 [compost metagenome]
MPRICRTISALVWPSNQPCRIAPLIFSTSAFDQSLMNESSSFPPPLPLMLSGFLKAAVLSVWSAGTAASRLIPTGNVLVSSLASKLACDCAMSIRSSCS